VQRKSGERDGYQAVQIGLVERTPRRDAPKPLQGHFANAGVPPTRLLAEVPVDADDEAMPGDSVLADIFAVDERVHVIGRSRGRGFQGVIRRHNYKGGRATHGSMFHRAPGSIGASADPSRVYPGTRLPGHMGDARVTVKNAKVVKVDADRNLLFIKGGVPGARNSYVRIVKVT
jgi:large subunit ribosomal protein L3